MTSYYSSIITLSWIALAALCISVGENDRIPKKDKKLFYISYCLIAVSALAEWWGIRLNGDASAPKWMILAANYCDYILTPLAGVSLIVQMKLHNIWSKILFAVLAFNIVLQFISMFTGGMVAIDEGNNATHGPLYAVYMVICFINMLLFVLELFIYGKSFRRQNRFSLYAILILIASGIIMQELPGSESKTTYIALTIGAALLYIHITEFSQQKVDRRINEQQLQISTDALTGALSRHAYSRALEDFDSNGKLPDGLVAFSIDINGLKEVNDTLGHDAGDELICGAADCIERVFGALGECYRTGGDEFVLLTVMEKDRAHEMMRRLIQETKHWSGKKVDRLTMAMGCAAASDHPGFTIEQLIIKADEEMYAAKTAYYLETGKDRRRR